MLNPNISWYIVEDEDILQKEEHYIGSYEPGNKLSIKTQVWNNKYGTEDVADARSPRIVIFFDTIENSILLKYLKVYIDNVQANIVYDLDKAYVYLENPLSGQKYQDETLMKSNYVEVKLEIENIPNGLQNSIKNLIVDLEYDNIKGGE